MAKRSRTSSPSSVTDDESNIHAASFFLNALEQKKENVAKDMGKLEGELTILEQNKAQLLRVTTNLKKEFMETKKEIEAQAQLLADTRKQIHDQWIEHTQKCEAALKANKQAIWNSWNSHQQHLDAQYELHRTTITSEQETMKKEIAAEKSRLAKLQIEYKGCEALLKMAHDELKQAHGEKYAADQERLVGMAKNAKSAETEGPKGREPPWRNTPDGSNNNSHIRVVSRPQTQHISDRVPLVLLDRHSHEPSGTIIEVNGERWKKGGTGKWWPAWSNRSGHAAKERQWARR